MDQKYQVQYCSLHMPNRYNSLKRLTGTINLCFVPTKIECGRSDLQCNRKGELSCLYIYIYWKRHFITIYRVFFRYYYDYAYDDDNINSQKGDTYNTTNQTTIQGIRSANRMLCCMIIMRLDCRYTRVTSNNPINRADCNSN